MPPSYHIFPLSLPPFIPFFSPSFLPSFLVPCWANLPHKSHLKAAMSTVASAEGQVENPNSTYFSLALCFISSSLIQLVYGTQFEMSLACRIKFRLLTWGKSLHLAHQTLSEESLLSYKGNLRNGPLTAQSWADAFMVGRGESRWRMANIPTLQRFLWSNGLWQLTEWNMHAYTLEPLQELFFQPNVTDMSCA